MRLIVITYLLILPGSAYAYLDPGTSSLIIQAVVAGVAAFMLTIGRVWESIKMYIYKLYGKIRQLF